MTLRGRQGREAGTNRIRKRGQHGECISSIAFRLYEKIVKPERVKKFTFTAKRRSIAEAIFLEMYENSIPFPGKSSWTNIAKLAVLFSESGHC